MTVAELKNAYTSHGGMLSEKDLCLALDISGTQDQPTEGYTVLRAGVLSVAADLSPVTVRRRYVNGEKSVPLSEKRKFTVTLLPDSEDGAVRFLLSAAEQGSPVRYTYLSLADGYAESGRLLPAAVRQEYVCGGLTAVIELENCL